MIEQQIQQIVDTATKDALEQESKKLTQIVISRINKILEIHNMRLTNVDIDWSTALVKLNINKLKENI